MNEFINPLFGDCMPYKISIIVPTYNAEKYLLKAVKSVINQSIGFKNIELILVDDNSSDGTKDIIQDLTRKYKNIVSVFSEKNSGSASKSRNIGINKATGDFIMFLDNDDYYCPNFCETMYNTITEYDADIVSCRNYDLKEGKIVKPQSVLDKKEDFIKLNSIDEDDTLLATPVLFVWNKIYNRNFLLSNKVLFPNNLMFEDSWFNLQAYVNSKLNIFLNDYFGYVYRVYSDDENSSSLSHDFNMKNLEKYYKSLNKIFSYLIAKNKNYPNFEAEILVIFTKWLLLIDCNEEYRLKIFKNLQPYYKRYKLTSRIYMIPLALNIFVNLGAKFMSFNETTFKIMVKLAKAIYN